VSIYDNYFRIKRMPKIKLISETIPSGNSVLLTHHQHSLARELTMQLTSLGNFKIENFHPGSSGPFSRPDVIIHLAGLGSPSLNETLSCTTELYDLLQIASRYSSRFILILPDSISHLKSTAHTLFLQFSQSHRLRSHIIEVNPDSDRTAVAQQIIRHFKYGYAYQSPRITPVVPLRKKFRRFRLHRFHLHFPWFVLFGVLVIPYLVILIQFLLVWGFTGCALKHLPQGRISRASICTARATAVSRAILAQTRFLPGSTYMFYRLNFPLHESVDTLTHLTDSLVLLEKSAAKANQLFAYFVNSITPGQWLDPGEYLIQFSALSESLSYLNSDLKNMYLSSPKPSPRLTTAAVQISSARQFLSRFQLLAPDMLRIFSRSGRTQYLLIIQDASRPKPSGGLIDTLAIITAQNGRIINFQALPADVADGQFRGLAEPPSDFARATGRNRWLLQDANWDPDFPAAAAKIAWFVNKELSLDINVVIALNTRTLARLISDVGQLEASDLSQVLTSADFSSRVGQSAPDNFLTTVILALEKQMRSLTPSQQTRIMFSLAQSLENREIFIAPLTFSVPGLSQSGWSGGLTLPECRGNLTCFHTFFYPVVTHLDSTPLTEPLDIRQNIKFDITPAQVLTTFAMRLHLKSPVYFRLYLASDAGVSSIMVNGTAFSPSNYWRKTTDRKNFIEIKIDPRPGDDSEFEVVTTQPPVPDGRFHYQMDLLNQPGLDASDLELGISYPPDWFATSYTTPSVASTGHLRYNTPVSGPVKVDIDFSPAP